MPSDLWMRVIEDEKQIADQFMAAPPVRVGALAMALGIDVLKSPLEPNVSGLIQPSASSRSGYEIKVNKFESPERQRFTIAHEIAHFLLHRADIGQGICDNALYRSNLTSRKEVEANRLGAEIIMPHAVIQRSLRDARLTATEEAVLPLASQFGVSAPAMRIRLGLS